MTAAPCAATRPVMRESVRYFIPDAKLATSVAFS